MVSCAISFALSLNESLVITTIPSDVEISEAITENYEFLNTESVTEYIYDDEFKILDEAKQLHTRRSRRTTIKPLSIRDRLNKYTRKTKIRVTKRKRTRPTPGHNIDVG